MDFVTPFLPLINTILVAVAVRYLIPWLVKKRKVEGADLLATVAIDVVALVKRRNPELTWLEALSELLTEIKKQFPKTDESVLTRVLASAWFDSPKPNAPAPPQ
jgi:hypothetical protein